jgi:hypothetical protein
MTTSVLLRTFRLGRYVSETFLNIFLAGVCWPLLCLCRPKCIFESCLDSNPESCRSKQARYQLIYLSPKLFVCPTMQTYFFNTQYVGFNLCVDKLWSQMCNPRFWRLSRRSSSIPSPSSALPAPAG